MDSSVTFFSIGLLTVIFLEPVRKERRHQQFLPLLLLVCRARVALLRTLPFSNFQNPLESQGEKAKSGVHVLAKRP